MEKQNVVTNNSPPSTEKTSEVVDQAVDLFVKESRPKEGLQNGDHGKDCRTPGRGVSGRV